MKSIVLKLLFSLVGIFSITAMARETQCTNFYPANGPIYSKNFSTETPASTQTFKFVSYNINLDQDINAIISDLTTIEALKDADFILLQEAAGTLGGPTNFVEPIAKALKMNYVFSPNMTLWEKDYGNAILSRWPLTSIGKILLPQSNKENCNLRSGLYALAQTSAGLIQLASVHLSVQFSDTIFGGDGSRALQLKPVLDTFAVHGDVPSFFAGDLNSFMPSGMRKIEDLTKQYGYSKAQTVSGWTQKKHRVQIDHAFAHGNWSYVQSGIAQDAQGSDHVPIWSVLRLAR